LEGKKLNDGPERSSVLIRYCAKSGHSEVRLSN
jgi:hypothetical protein